MAQTEPNIGESLKRFRHEFKLRQGDIAEAIGILQQMYYKYESGKVTPSANIIYKIATTYDVSADYLLGISKNPAPTDKRLLEAVTTCHEILNNVLEKRGLENGRVQDNESAERENLRRADAPL